LFGLWAAKVSINTRTCTCTCRPTCTVLHSRLTAVAFVDSRPTVADAVASVVVVVTSSVPVLAFRLISSPTLVPRHVDTALYNRTRRSIRYTLKVQCRSNGCKNRPDTRPGLFFQTGLSYNATKSNRNFLSYNCIFSVVMVAL